MTRSLRDVVIDAVGLLQRFDEHAASVSEAERENKAPPPIPVDLMIASALADELEEHLRARGERHPMLVAHLKTLLGGFPDEATVEFSGPLLVDNKPVRLEE